LKNWLQEHRVSWSSQIQVRFIPSSKLLQRIKHFLDRSSLLHLKADILAWFTTSYASAMEFLLSESFTLLLNMQDKLQYFVHGSKTNTMTHCNIFHRSNTNMIQVMNYCKLRAARSGRIENFLRILDSRLCFVDFS
jgi:hypothetical protein